MKKITIIGTGYVGLVTGLVFAKKDFEVLCLDSNSSLVENLRSGHSPIFEPGIKELLEEAQAKFKISFATHNDKFLSSSEIVFICVNTPYNENGIDFTQLIAALTTCGEVIKNSEIFKTIVVKSTVIPGTTNGIVKRVLEDVSQKKYGNDFGIAVNPEFLREGNALEDFLNADRIIIGTEQKQSIDILQEVYATWQCDKIVVNADTAEFIKYYSNSFLAMLISFSNEMANLANAHGNIDFKKVIKSIQLDKRLSPTIKNHGQVTPDILNYLIPGPGYGGSCLPKDIKAFAHFANSKREEVPILKSIIETNESQVDKIIQLIQKRIKNATAKRYLILGVAHKPNTDDIRASIALKIIEKLSVHSKVSVHDPVASKQIETIFKENNYLEVVKSWEVKITEADVIVLLTSWTEYRLLEHLSKEGKLKGKYLVDTRYFFKEDLEGVNYICL